MYLPSAFGVSGARARLRSHIAPAAARARAQLDLVNTRSGKRLYMQSVWMVHLSITTR